MINEQKANGLLKILLFYFMLACVVTSISYRVIFPVPIAILCGIFVFIIYFFQNKHLFYSIQNVLFMSVLQIFYVFFVYLFVSNQEFKAKAFDYFEELIILLILGSVYVVLSCIDKKTLKSLVWAYLLVMGFCLCCTLYVEITGPEDVIRDTVSGTFYDSILPYGYFDFIYMLDIVFFVLLYFYSLKRRMLKIRYRCFLIVFLILSFLTIALSGYSSAFSVAVFSILLCVLLRRKYKFLTLFIFVLLFYIFSESIASFIRSLPLSELTTKRLSSIILSITGKEQGTLYLTGEGQRIDRIKWSLDVLWENPLFGGFFGDTVLPFGNHTEWIDRIAQYGLVYAVFNFGYWVCIYKAMIRRSQSCNLKYIRTGFIIFLIVGCLNPISMIVTSAPIFLLIPFLDSVFGVDKKSTRTNF